jgi:archaellum component FlaC
MFNKEKIKGLEANIKRLEKRVEGFGDEIYKIYEDLKIIKNYITKEHCDNCCHTLICKKNNIVDIIDCKENKKCEFQTLR